MEGIMQNHEHAIVGLVPVSVAIANGIMRRTLAVLFLFLSFCWASHAAEQGVMLVVGEGAEAQGSSTEIASRYQDFAKRIAAVLKRPVVVLPIARIDILRQTIAEGRADLAWLRPITFIGEAIATNRYTLVASAEGEFYSAFIVSKNSPLKTLRDLEGKQVMHPPKSGPVYKMGAAELRDLRVKAELREQRLQEVIVYSVENGFADAGLVNQRQAAKYKKEGGRVLHETRKFPSWGLVASSKISASEIEALRKLLLFMNQAPWGKDILAALEVNGFVASNPKSYLELIDWIK
jgi:ABC-type phosphate/phosphonate transport system substrate-binding protein